MASFPRLTLSQVTKLLQLQRLTSEDIVAYCYALAQAGESVWKMNAYERINDWEDLRLQAREADKRRHHGETLSALDGIPVSIKANIAVRDQPLTAGSRILGAQGVDSATTPQPVGYNADVVRCLLDQNGAILVGMTTQDEFGMGSLGTNVVVDETATKTACRNPVWLRGYSRAFSDDEVVSTVKKSFDSLWKEHQKIEITEVDFSAGGSSCGSAVSVAHGSALISVGSDTGGSVRLPAAWCGIVGLKPTYGLLSREGLVSYASSMDTIGILAPSVQCASLALDHLQAEDPIPANDSNDPGSSLGEGDVLKSLKVGVPSAFCVREMDPCIRDTWKQVCTQLQSSGSSVSIETCLDSDLLQAAMPAYYVLAVAEASSNLARYDGFRYGVADKLGDNSDVDNDITHLQSQYSAVRTKGFGIEVKRRILCGTSVLSSTRFDDFYLAACAIRSALTRQLLEALSQHDVLLVPTTVSQTPSLANLSDDPIAMYGNDVMTVPFSLAGLPVVSVAEQRSGFGFQVVGLRNSEEDMLRFASEFTRLNRSAMNARQF